MHLSVYSTHLFSFTSPQRSLVAAMAGATLSRGVVSSTRAPRRQAREPHAHRSRRRASVASSANATFPLTHVLKGQQFTPELLSVLFDEADKMAHVTPVRHARQPARGPYGAPVTHRRARPARPGQPLLCVGNAPCASNALRAQSGRKHMLLTSALPSRSTRANPTPACPRLRLLGGGVGRCIFASPFLCPPLPALAPRARPSRAACRAT